MCFSAEASFAGAAILAGIGYGTVKQASSKQDLLWLSIPLFFAIQQFCEGIVWLGLTHKLSNSMLTVTAKNIYLFFALGFWPAWIPLAFLVPEKNPTKRKLLLALFLLGLSVAYNNLAILPPSELSPSVTGHSIRYFSESSFEKKTIYLLVVALPSFISSIKYTWMFGFATVITCLTAEYFYSSAFTSVWCFAAAVMSVFLYVIARNYAKDSTLQTESIRVENNKNSRSFKR